MSTTFPADGIEFDRLLQADEEPERLFHLTEASMRNANAAANSGRAKLIALFDLVCHGVHRQVEAYAARAANSLSRRALLLARKSTATSDGERKSLIFIGIPWQRRETLT